MGLWRWMHSPSKVRLPRPDHVVELAWLPLWQCQLLLHHLWEQEVPATMSEDHTSFIRFAAREPMGRLFVMEPRLDLARQIARDILGFDPPKQDR